MRSRTQRRRGLSTVIVTSMLLAATALSGAFIVSWSNSNLLSKQITLEETYSNNINKLNEYIIVEDVWFGTSPSDYVNVTMTNAGSIGLNYTKISLINSTKTVNFYYTNEYILPQNQVSKQLTYDWTSGVPITISVTTARDRIFQVQVSP